MKSWFLAFSFSYLARLSRLLFPSLLSLLFFFLLFLSPTQETSTVANGQAYNLSKAMAEKEAWKIAEAKG